MKATQAELEQLAKAAIFAYSYYIAETDVGDERAEELAVASLLPIGYTEGTPTIVCLCGSTRFWREFQAAGLRETMAGKIVLSIGAASGTDDEHFGGLPQAEYDAIKTQLDELHMRKIDLADEVLILNKRQPWCPTCQMFCFELLFRSRCCDAPIELRPYIGESTARELAYAQSHGKRVRYLEEPS